MRGHGRVVHLAVVCRKAIFVVCDPRGSKLVLNSFAIWFFSLDLPSQFRHWDLLLAQAVMCLCGQSHRVQVLRVRM